MRDKRRRIARMMSRGFRDGKIQGPGYSSNCRIQERMGFAMR